MAYYPPESGLLGDLPVNTPIVTKFQPSFTHDPFIDHGRWQTDIVTPEEVEQPTFNRND
jgi:hypothetical protein